MKIFLSHIHEEVLLALVIKDWIESSFPGLCQVFVSSDIKDIPAGLKWFKEISGALDDSRSFIVLCSPLSIQRPWINFETGCAWIKKVPVIPLCHSGLSKSDLPRPLSEFQALEVLSPQFSNDLLSSLATHIMVEKFPRIDTNSMMAEIKEAISKIQQEIGELITPENDMEMDDPIPNKVLKYLADQGDKGNSLEELAIKFELSEPKMEYYLDVLVSKSLIRKSGALAFIGSYYYLTKEGRKYLVDQGLL